MKIIPAWRSLLLILLLCGLAWGRLSPALHQPLLQDELVTIKKYASVDYDGTTDTMRRLSRFDYHRSIHGVVRCFYNTWDPNNHILNSLLISGSTFLFGFNEFAYRAPSLLALLLLLALAFCWIERLTGSRPLAFLGGLALAFHPYFALYGVLARGYTWTAFLVLLQIWLVQRSFQRKPSFGSTFALGLLSALIFFNLASMLVTWILPFYLAIALYLAASDRPPGKTLLQQLKDNERLRAWIYQALIALAIIIPFILANLPNFMQAQHKYGVHLHSAAGLFPQLAAIFSYLFPAPWPLFAVLGLIGLILMLRPATFNWIGLTAIVALLTTVTYILVTRTVPFPRVFGFHLVLLLIGLASLWNVAVPSLRLVMRGIILTVLVLSLAGQLALGRKISEPGAYTATLAANVGAQIKAGHEQKDSVFIPLPWIVGEEMRYYLPEGPDWSTLGPDKKDPLNIYWIVEKNNSTNRFRVQYARRDEQQMVYWNLPAELSGVEFPGLGAVVKIRAHLLRDFSQLAPGQFPWLVVWNNQNTYFNLPAYVADQLGRQQPPWTLPVNTTSYLPVKSLQIFLQNSADLDSAKAIIADLKSKSTGEVYLLVPEVP